jgi:hypothetical protein
MAGPGVERQVLIGRLVVWIVVEKCVGVWKEEVIWKCSGAIGTVVGVVVSNLSVMFWYHHVLDPLVSLSFPLFLYFSCSVLLVFALLNCIINASSPRLDTRPLHTIMMDTIYLGTLVVSVSGWLADACA